jgi:hypothetical protein
MQVALHEECPQFVAILTKLETDRQMSVKFPVDSTKIHQIEPRYIIQTDGRTEGQTDMAKLIVDIRNCFAKAPKNGKKM